MKKSQFVISLAMAFCCAGPAVQGKDKAVLIDSEGRRVCETQFRSLTGSFPGLYFGQVDGGHENQVFDKNGNPLPINLPDGFHLESLILPREEQKKVHTELPENTLFDVKKAGLHGIIDMRGLFVVQPEYDSIREYDNGLYELTRATPDPPGTKSRFFDLRTRHISAKDFPGLTPSSYSEGMIGYTEPPKRRRNFNSRSAWYNYSGYCDIEHNVVIPPIFENVCAFKDGLAMVFTRDPAITSRGAGLPRDNRTGTRAVFIDKSGHFVAPEIIPQSQFQDGYAIAATADKPTVVGLIDRKLKLRAPAQYESLQLVARNIYAAKLANTTQWIAINSTGSKLFDFPKGTLSFEFFDPNGPDSDANYILAKVDDGKHKPPEGYLQNDCLIDKQGKVLIPPDYFLRRLRFGMIDASSGYRGERQDGVMNCDGKWVLPFQSAYFEVVEPDRIIKTVLSDKFSSDDWKEPIMWGAKWDLFAKFLNDYDLIGMSLAQVRELLGKGTELTDDAPANIYRCNYTLLSGPCGNAWQGFTLEFEDRVVKRWRFAGFMDQPNKARDWFTENMVYDKRAEPNMQRMIRKRSTGI